MKLMNIVIVLALACVPVQSDDAGKNLRGESAVGVPEKEQDVTAQKESTEEVGAVLAELDTSAEATEGVDEQERAARKCKRWVPCTPHGLLGNKLCPGGFHCMHWQHCC